MKESIQHACLKYNNKYYLDQSHDLCFQQIKKIDNSPILVGFMTNLNNFVDRKKAAIIAFNANQIETETKLLFSEHLWSEMYNGKYNYDSEKGYVLSNLNS